MYHTEIQRISLAADDQSLKFRARNIVWIN